MPDLRRASYFSREAVDVPESAQKGLDGAVTYREAREILRRFEVVPSLTLRETIAVLLQMGATVSQIQIVPVGVESSWRGEVVGQYPRPGEEIRAGSPIRIFVSHASLADRLPEGFLNKPPHRLDADLLAWREGAGADAFWRQLEARRREESPEMRILRAFESELWHARLALYELKNAFTGFSDDSDLASELLAALDFVVPAAVMDEPRLQWLARDLHEVTRSRGLEWETARLLEDLLALPISIRPARTVPLPIPEQDRHRLGDPGCRVAGGAILGTHLEDRSPGLTLVVGPLTFVEAFELSRSVELQSALEECGGALLPVGGPWKVTFSVQDESAPPRLGDKAPAAVLGLTATLRPRAN